jgi:uncharacterized protein with PIN domain
MAIPCPQCGREYDVTLFQFGRTIDCTCGGRVGLEKRLGPPVSSAEPRFIADAMLGGLARWLRILGYDTSYDAAIQDAEMVRQSLTEGRNILTRDRRIPDEWRISGCMIVEAEDTESQLREVVGRFDLQLGSRVFTRCTLCNALLTSVSRNEVEGRVPERVLEHHKAFSLCPHCDQVYWQGSHTERILSRLRTIMDG